MEASVEGNAVFDDEGLTLTPALSRWEREN